MRYWCNNCLCFNSLPKIWCFSVRICRERERERERERAENYLSNFTFSLDGKKPLDKSKFKNLDIHKKIKLYKAHKISKNIGSILEITADNLLEINNNKVVDLITYSFPCQDLSVAGSFYGFNKGMSKNSNTRSSLLWEIGRILTELKVKNKLPKFLLLENVPNMISSRHMPEYIKWKKFLYNLGYKTKTYKHSAYDHGIPQIRKRVYAISILDADLPFDKKEYEIKCCDSLPLKLEKEKSIKTKTLKDIIKQDYSINKYKEEALKANPNRTISRKKMFDENFVLNDFKKHKYARTLTTRQDRHPNAGVIDLRKTSIECKDLSKAKYRFLTTREAYLLMGFSEKDYERVKKQNIKEAKLYQQAGNSIVVNAIVPVIKKIQELNNE